MHCRKKFYPFWPITKPFVNDYADGVDTMQIPYNICKISGDLFPNLN